MQKKENKEYLQHVLVLKKYIMTQQLLSTKITKNIYFMRKKKKHLI